jgi:hypothetical protein
MVFSRAGCHKGLEGKKARVGFMCKGGIFLRAGFSTKGSRHKLLRFCLWIS